MYHGCDVNYILILCVHLICHLSLCSCCSYEAINPISWAPESSLLGFAQGMGLNAKIFCFHPKLSGYTAVQGKVYASIALLFYWFSTNCLLWLKTTLKH